MPRNDSNRSTRRAPAALALVSVALASLALAACGGSSSEDTASSAARTTASVSRAAAAHAIAGLLGTSKSTTSKAAAPTSSASKSATRTKSGVAGENVTSVLRACLRHHVKHCALPSGGPAAQHVHIQSPPSPPAKSPPPVPKSTTGAPPASPTGGNSGATSGKDAFQKFAACLRANGVSVQSVGGGSTPGPEAKAAEAKCLVYLDGGS